MPNGIYNPAPQFEGDTLRPMVLTVEYRVNGTIKSLAGATVNFVVVRGKQSKVYLTLTSPGDIEINDPETGVITIKPKINPQLVAGDYQYYIQIEYADGTIRTVLGGDFPIRSAITAFKPELL